MDTTRRDFLGKIAMNAAMLGAMPLSFDLASAAATAAPAQGEKWDLGWVGRVQFLVIQQKLGRGDKGIEADSNKNNNDQTPRSAPEIWNMTMIGGDGAVSDPQGGIHLRRGTGGQAGSFLPHQALLDQRPDRIEYVHSEGRRRNRCLPGPVVIATHRLGRLEREATEDRQPPEHGLLGGLQEVVAPGDRVAEGTLPGREIARTAGQERQPELQAPDHDRWRQQAHPRRGEPPPVPSLDQGPLHPLPVGVVKDSLVAEAGEELG